MWRYSPDVQLYDDGRLSMLSMLSHAHFGVIRRRLLSSDENVAACFLTTLMGRLMSLGKSVCLSETSVFIFRRENR